MFLVLFILEEVLFHTACYFFMSTRQMRLSTPDQIQNKLKEFTGKKINIVLFNRKVLFGELREIGQTTLTFVNMRQEPVSLPLKEVSEVYLDFKE